MRFRFRPCISLFTFATFTIMAVTGLVLFIMPPGRIAYWTHWRLAGLGKDHWGNVHIVSSLFFILSGILHVYYNWRPFWSYIKEKASAGLRLRAEMWAATVLIVLLVAGSLLPLPPLTSILRLNAYFKEVWVDDPALEPPFGHAELLSLSGFSRKMDIELPEAVKALREAGIEFDSARQSLEKIARANGVPPVRLYQIIRPFQKEPAQIPVEGGLTAEAVEGRFAGTGIGMKTIAEIATQTGTEAGLLAERLRQAGLDFDNSDSLREISERNGQNPLEVLKIMLVTGYGGKELRSDK
ncbi:DUF4405 domain-containing protein [bacterium]|nr:DUF4405 domain-containing protein [bacterium]